MAFSTANLCFPWLGLNHRNAILRFRHLVGAIVAFVVLILGTAPTGAREIAPDPTKIVYVKTHDGVRLAAAVYLPAGKEPFPTLFAASSYRFDNDEVPDLPVFVWKETGPIAFYLQHGYAYVHMDLRGSGRSGGQYLYYDKRDGQDSRDMIEWIARQPWSNGKVGGVGHSIYAMEQWYIAASKPRNLACIAPFDGATDVYSLAHPGGVSSGFEANIYNNQFRVLNMYPLKGPARILDQDFVLSNAEHTALDSYWKRKVILPDLPKVAIPVFSIGVWQNVNNHLDGNITGYQAVSGPKKLLLFGTNAQVRFETRTFQEKYILPFYDWCLKGERTSYLDQPAVQFFMPGTGKFYKADRWPPMGTSEQTLYLSPEKSESLTSLNDGTLQAAPASEASSSTTYSYPNPNWTVGVVGAGPDGKPDPVRNILTFTSAPLTEDLMIAGPVRVVLFASSTRPDTWFFVRLSDQSPQASADHAGDVQPMARMLTRGMLAATHRESDEHPSAAVPGKIYKFEIKMKPTANLFKKGDRIRLEIANGDSTLTDGLFAAIYRPNQVGADTIYHSAAYPSALILPIAPSNLETVEP